MLMAWEEICNDSTNITLCTFQHQRLGIYSIDEDRKMIMNGEYYRTWHDADVAYLKMFTGFSMCVTL
jgi:hypothetical protein